LQRRYRVKGLDLSEKMREIAAAKVPKARLVHSDMRRFDLGEAFDVVLCVYDSINHLMTFEEWEAVFDRASEL
jgi:predicted TPR repeat methyltransferase